MIAASGPKVIDSFGAQVILNDLIVRSHLINSGTRLPRPSPGAARPPWKARPLLRIRYGKARPRSAFAELRYGPRGED